ncbi:E3 ubiquitin-protein ligase TRIM39 isoform X2 [Alligator mississippiensis]|uniref:E3 ubiquitin-protein ligase TRIM39 isoform X2 n=1 Tax=Alligator mississippiensis TaxID=8496 RepID=UPI002877F49F|nr:E3 ubiquitin-protein ligase TRIM39 isoform X2 [Alligator mississippiensis]
MGKDIRITMSRCEKGQVQLPAEISPEIETRLENLSEKTLTVKETMRQFQVTVTLDPDMAHPCLIVSADRRSVRSAETQYWLPNSPDRFHVNQCALGRERFMSGRHWWDVKVEVGEWWAVGVARESGRRKGEIRYSPEEEVWGVLCWGGEFFALTPLVFVSLSRCRVPSRVRVALDCEQEQVSFLDVDTKALIFTLPLDSFTGDTIWPWLWVCGAGSKLRLCH